MAEARRIPPGVQTDPLGPGFFPYWLGAGIALCGALLAAGVLVGVSGIPGLGTTLMADAPEGDIEEEGEFSHWRLIAAVGITALYVAAFEPVGYLLATPAYIAAIMLAHGGARPRSVLSAAIAVTIVLYASFRFGLLIPVPVGLLRGILPW